mmetsp:Transcript_24253/g.59805  ORF Transcript_24253/g.59805 Transcript_24253/m.59805 type:complete len:390 (+) Transcript_24253:121-1290(+)|eukprot:CAMPEP_0206229092 /NCGR_PEP_ID=MMETSP0047_2-20121206/9510_1 /ASSEMBLY_ACC=CAM_ASM_000192 /TAXON_ID=195065 /ORGANISM="Chroomonas mesostigmatica_cf, Strain CCMP1168" /LENGTH=389 /DNA_ID=CAMNT_0053652363 /DNA_START=121 /DNA_END=1290 /DNA_ORIENTATION=+
MPMKEDLVTGTWPGDFLFQHTAATRSPGGACRSTGAMADEGDLGVAGHSGPRAPTLERSKTSSSSHPGWVSDNSREEAPGAAPQDMDLRSRHKALEQRRRDEKKLLMDTLQELVGIEFNKSKVPSVLNTILEATLDFLQDTEVVRLRKKAANGGWPSEGACDNLGPQQPQQPLRSWSEVPEFASASFNSAPVPMVMATPQGNVVRCNPAAFSLFSANKAEPPTIFSIAAEESLADCITAISRLLAGQEDRITLHKNCTVRSGETVGFQVNMHCLRDREKNARFLFCTLRPQSPPSPKAAPAPPQEHQAAGQALSGSGLEPQAPVQEPAPQVMVSGPVMCHGSNVPTCGMSVPEFVGGDVMQDPLMDEIFEQLEVAYNQNTPGHAVAPWA